MMWRQQSPIAKVIMATVFAANLSVAWVQASNTADPVDSVTQRVAEPAGTERMLRARNVPRRNVPRKSVPRRKVPRKSVPRRRVPTSRRRVPTSRRRAPRIYTSTWQPTLLPWEGTETVTATVDERWDGPETVTATGLVETGTVTVTGTADERWAETETITATGHVGTVATTGWEESVTATRFEETGTATLPGRSEDQATRWPEAETMTVTEVSITETETFTEMAKPSQGGDVSNRVVTSIPPLVATSSSPPTCGCGWRHHKACSVSAHQLLQALQHSRVEKLCEATRGKGEERGSSLNPNAGSLKRTRFECGLRAQIRQRARSMQETCLMKGEESCQRLLRSGCRWEAQAMNECGISEAHLIHGLLDPEDDSKAVPHEHPLFQALLMHDHCSGFDRASCPRPNCMWRGHMCDVNPTIFFEMILQRPSLLNVFTLTSRGAYCRARYEHGVADGEPGVCNAPCVNEHGICRLDVALAGGLVESNGGPSSKETVQRMVTVFCMRLGRQENSDGKVSCMKPCSTKTFNNMTICLGPDELPEDIESNFSMTHEDFEVAEVYMTVRGATMVYENHCAQFSDNFESCQASSAMCPEDFTPDFERTTAGLPGFMSEVAEAVDQGKLHDLFNKHVDSELTNFDADEVTKDIGVLSKWLTPPEKGWNPHDDDRKVPWDSLGKDDEDEADDDKGKEWMPWLLAGSAFLLAAAAACGGLALGVWCASRPVLNAGIRPQRLATNPGDEESNPESPSYRRFEELQ